ncbi:hypothetical protein ACOMHN_061146 [Nucella lapillus]
MVVRIFSASLPYKGERCIEGTFYDHGTELCEPCEMICKDADVNLMMEECHRLCPQTYAQLTNKQHRPQNSALSPSPSRHSAKDTHSSPSTSLMVLLLIVGIVVGILVVSVLVILGAFVLSGLNRSRQGYRPPGVQEEGGDGAVMGGDRASGGPHQGGGRGVGAYCDPRQWFGPAVDPPVEETPSGRQGTQEISLLGNNQGSVVQDLQQTKTVVATPIYKPSGSMRSTRI